jgi:hypothetical protein
MKSKHEIATFFGEVQRVISKYGIDHVMNKLREIHYEHTDAKDRDVCEYILAITSTHYRVVKDDVLKSKKRGVISEARRMCYALMKEHLPISDQEIANYFGGKSRQLVNREIKNLPLNQDKFATKDEAKFVDDFLVLTVEVLKYRNNYELNDNMLTAKRINNE